MGDTERLNQVRTVVRTITSRMVLPLYFIFFICDLVYVPHLMWEFLLLRTLILPAAFLTHRWIRGATCLAQGQRIALFYTAALSLPITAMVAMIGEPSSPYYAGLNLVAVGMLSFIPWTARYFVLGAVVIYLPYYAVALYEAMHTGVYQYVAINTFFIGGTLIITAVIRLFRERLQEKDRESRAQLLEGKARLQQEIESRKQAEKEALEARDEALNASRAKDVFLANMSHELRTPLNAVLGYTEIIRDDLNEHGIQQYNDDCGKIIGAGRHLLELINTVLDMSKVAAGKMNVSYDTVDIAELVETVVMITSPLMAKNDNQFVTSIQPGIGTIRADEVKLRQCLINIIGNAAKFTQNGKVSLTVKSERIAGEDWIYFRIDDTGIGMTAEQCRKIFDPFTQATVTTTRNYGGTGLGLSISRSFARMMYGDIAVKSNPGEGSAFTLVLPREEGRHEQLKAQRGNRERRRSDKIALLVDDGSIDVEHLEMLLVSNSISFDVLGRNAQSLDKFMGEVGAPDLVIAGPKFVTAHGMALNMPGIIVAESAQFDGTSPLGVHVVATPETWRQRVIEFAGPGSGGQLRVLVFGSGDDSANSGNIARESGFSCGYWRPGLEPDALIRAVSPQWIIIEPGAITDITAGGALVQAVNNSGARVLLSLDGKEREKTRRALHRLVSAPSVEADKMLSSTAIKLFRRDSAAAVPAEAELERAAEGV